MSNYQRYVLFTKFTNHGYINPTLELLLHIKTHVCDVGISSELLV